MTFGQLARTSQFRALPTQKISGRNAQWISAWSQLYKSIRRSWNGYHRDESMKASDFKKSQSLKRLSKK